MISAICSVVIGGVFYAGVGVSLYVGLYILLKVLRGEIKKNRADAVIVSITAIGASLFFMFLLVMFVTK